MKLTEFILYFIVILQTLSANSKTLITRFEASSPLKAIQRIAIA